MFRIFTGRGSYVVRAKSETDARADVQRALAERMRQCSEQLGRVSEWLAVPEK